MYRDVLEYAMSLQCQELHLRVDPHTQLKAIIAIHNTTLGPALGGCRCLAYDSSLEAMIDAIRLARAMTYKAAISGLSLGGGKMVLMKPAAFDENAYFKCAGRLVDSLGGRYITAVDSGTSVEAMDIIATETTHVTCTTKSVFSNADPSVMAARGVQRGIEAAVKYRLGKDTLQGLHVCIQGLGNAGYNLAKNLQAAGVQLTVYDIDPNAVKRCVETLGAKAVSSLEELLQINCDVFAPCALGAVLNDHSLSLLKAPIVAGSANNQLKDPKHGHELMQRGILYAPDYVINAGGLIYVASQYTGITEQETLVKIDAIYQVLLEIFRRSEGKKIATSEVADTIAEERFQKGSV